VPAFRLNRFQSGKKEIKKKKKKRNKERTKKRRKENESEEFRHGNAVGGK
jgi:hypothetical protein